MDRPVAHDFKIGDEVVVVLQNAMSFGCRGRVTELQGRELVRVAVEGHYGSRPFHHLNLKKSITSANRETRDVVEQLRKNVLHLTADRDADRQQYERDRNALCEMRDNAVGEMRAATRAMEKAREEASEALAGVDAERSRTAYAVAEHRKALDGWKTAADERDALVKTIEQRPHCMCDVLRAHGRSITAAFDNGREAGARAAASVRELAVMLREAFPGMLVCAIATLGLVCMLTDRLPLGQPQLALQQDSTVAPVASPGWTATAPVRTGGFTIIGDTTVHHPVCVKCLACGMSGDLESMGGHDCRAKKNAELANSILSGDWHRWQVTFPGERWPRASVHLCARCSQPLGADAQWTGEIILYDKDGKAYFTGCVKCLHDAVLAGVAPVTTKAYR